MAARRHRGRARLTLAVGRWGPDVARRYARLVDRARRAQLAAVARLRRPRDDDASWLVSWATAYLRAALVVSVAALALIAVKAIAAGPDDPPAALVGAVTLEGATSMIAKPPKKPKPKEIEIEPVANQKLVSASFG